jgi:sulfite exporter TauE/SafE
MSQSPLRGAEFLLAFGLGTLPLLWFAQHQYHFWQQRISPKRIDQVQRAVALVAASVIGIRLILFDTTSTGLFCGN